MRTEQNSPVPKTPPTMLPPVRINPLQEIKHELENLGRNPDFLKTANAVAEKTGCKVLFEVPGLLFALPCTRAVAILLKEPSNNENLFILHRDHNGTVQVIRGKNIPEKVNRFVQSYLNVLSFMPRAN